jgi:hypothetical protein
MRFAASFAAAVGPDHTDAVSVDAQGSIGPVAFRFLGIDFRALNYRILLIR